MTRKSLTQPRDELTRKVEQVMDENAKLLKKIEMYRKEVDENGKLTKTLLTIIMEEADGVQSGAAPTIPNQPKQGFCM